MKPGILVTRALFPEVIDRLAAHFEVDYHPEDRALPPDQLAARLAGKDGAITLLSDRIDAAALAGAPGLRALCNVAVGYNNYDLAAITAAGVMATNTPGVLDETTADAAWALLMASARRIVGADRWVRDGRWTGWKFHDDWLGSDVHRPRWAYSAWGASVGQSRGALPVSRCASSITTANRSPPSRNASATRPG